MTFSTETQFRAPRSPLVASGECDLHQRDMTATFSVDLKLAEVQKRLAEIGQWLPIDGDPSATLAILIDTNSTGPLRLGYGAWRDLLLGVQFTNGRGELITAGGRTVKNVAGYDLTKFMVGHSGVFGRLITITTRTYRRPACALVVRYLPDPKIVAAVMPTEFRPQWALLSNDALLLGYLGDDTTIDYLAAELPRTRPIDIFKRVIEEDIADRARLWNATGSVVYRAAVPPSRILDFVGKAAINNWVADAAFGIVIGAAGSGSDAAFIREAASGLGGTVITRRDSVTGPLLDVSTNAVERQIIERLKRAFDPDNTLTPLPWH